MPYGSGAKSAQLKPPMLKAVLQGCTSMLGNMLGNMVGNGSGLMAADVVGMQVVGIQVVGRQL